MICATGRPTRRGSSTRSQSRTLIGSGKYMTISARVAGRGEPRSTTTRRRSSLVGDRLVWVVWMVRHVRPVAVQHARLVEHHLRCVVERGPAASATAVLDRRLIVLAAQDPLDPC